MEALYKNIHQDVIDRCRAGEREAQFQLYKIYYQSMYNTSLRIVGNSTEAEDVMQEAFLSAFKKIETYAGQVSFGAWLKKIVVNRSLDYLKKRRVQFEELDERLADETEAPMMEPQGVDVQKIKKAIFKLPEGYRVVLSLYLLEGYDHDEISEILNISNSSSRSQLLRAKKKLREYLLKDEVFSIN
ncbi:RNA polymerase sigma factor [uncultured Sunxiuqinia sp.]|uniref:RNA polymerase sigma factor n=1 Tax=Sunxiuqinia rutila TaxID=1397841 RepID=UPI002613E92F|nr:sigma-70 family RNA polymerase sigma factor [uncultured Sunxiuqinia sp.]